MFMRLPANDPAPTASPRVKTKLATAMIALLFAIAMMACGSESSPSTEATPPATVSQTATQSGSGSADSSTSGNATTAATGRQQPTAGTEQQGQQSTQPEATVEPASSSAGETPTDEPDPTATMAPTPTATMAPTPTLEPNENAFQWLLHESDKPHCPLGTRQRDAIASTMNPHFATYVHEHYSESMKGLSETLRNYVLEHYSESEHYTESMKASVEDYRHLGIFFYLTLRENLQLERLPDENGELRVKATFTGPVPPITDDVLIVTWIPNLYVRPAVGYGLEHCNVKGHEFMAAFEQGEEQGEEVTIEKAQ